MDLVSDSFPIVWFIFSQFVWLLNWNLTHNTVSSPCLWCACAVKVCDAIEVAGKNVLSTSSVVTTGLVSHRYILI